MNEEHYKWIPLAFLTTLTFCYGLYAIGLVSGETSGRDKGIAYCMEQPKNCAIEYTYMKHKEKSK